MKCIYAVLFHHTLQFKVRSLVDDGIVRVQRTNRGGGHTASVC